MREQRYCPVDDHLCSTTQSLLNDNDDGTLIGSSFVGTQGLVESSEIVWDFPNLAQQE